MVAVPVESIPTNTTRSKEIAESAVAVTVTEVGPAPSPTLEGFAERVTAGRSSSSVSVIDVPPTPKIPIPDFCVPLTEITSVSSTRLSLTGVRMKVAVPVFLFAGTVTSNHGTSL